MSEEFNEKQPEQHDEENTPSHSEGSPGSFVENQPPEPPAGYVNNASRPASAQQPNQNQGQIPNVKVGNKLFVVDGFDVVGFEAARKMNVAAQIVAIVSLFFGGVIASSVAVGLAIASYFKFRAVAETVSQEDLKVALRRSGIVAIVMSSLALLLNIVSLVVFMPMLMQVLQTGDYSALFGSTGAGSGTGSTNSTWG